MTGTREAPKESIYEALLSQVSQQKKNGKCIYHLPEKTFQHAGRTQTLHVRIHFSIILNALRLNFNKTLTLS
jgi:hypothetical protein